MANNKAINPFASARLKVGLTIREAAKVLSVNPSTIVDWEQGRSLPRAETLKEISNAFGVSVDSLISSPPRHKVPHPASQERPDDGSLWSRRPDLWAPSNNGWPRIDHDGSTDGIDIEGCSDCGRRDRLCQIHAQIEEFLDEGDVA